MIFRESIRPEVSWNYGASLTQEFKIGEMSGNFIMDFYRTDFENQLVADMEDPRYMRFYNLRRKSLREQFSGRSKPDAHQTI